MIMALKIAEKSLATLGAFLTILRAIIMLNPRNFNTLLMIIKNMISCLEKLLLAARPRLSLRY